MSVLVKLSAEEIALCRRFSFQCASQQQDIEFGQKDTAARCIQEIGRDNLIGKIGEVTFARFLRERYGIEVPLDFNYYPRGVWDDQDVSLCGWSIDVKATRQRGHWLLVEWNKLAFRAKDGQSPDLFVMCSVGWDREKDVPTGDVWLMGCASERYLCRKGVIFRKGTHYQDPNMTFQADNYGLPFERLEQDWDKVIDYLQSHRPPPKPLRFEVPA